METELIPLRSIKEKINLIRECECLGIAAPIYGLNFASNVIKWMQTIPKTSKKKFFLIDTNAGLPGTAILRAKRLLTEKGWEFIGGLEITAPTRDSVFWTDFYRYISWNKKEIKRAFLFGRRLVLRLKKRDKKIIKEFRIMPLSSILSALFPFLERKLFRIMTRLMAHDPKKCTLCGVCESICTTGSIDLKRRIFFDPHKCIFCFACMRNCPKGALFLKIYPKAQFFKGPYQIKGYISADTLS